MSLFLSLSLRDIKTYCVCVSSLIHSVEKKTSLKVDPDFHQQQLCVFQEFSGSILFHKKESPLLFQLVFFRGKTRETNHTGIQGLQHARMWLNMH